MDALAITPPNDEEINMAKLLQINSSLFGDNGNSTTLANDFVQRWKTQNPAGEVIVRDFATEAVPHLDATRVQALFSPAESRTREPASSSSA